MHFTKDSFYLALRDRLASLNPARVITLNGITRPAIVVRENEPLTAARPMPNTFYLDFGEPKAHPRLPAPLLSLECHIAFEAESSTEAATDRGRLLSQLTTELLAVCSPQHTRKRDFTQAPSVDLGTNIFWSKPRLDDSEPASSPSRLRRIATVTLFFFPEQELA